MNEKSGHWTNTGMAKFINDNLYNYDSEDEKSMNPFRWHHVQNGDDVSNYRETINGFPCRLILVNDGNTPLNEGQNEPTPGNTKDMGIFNFNHDKDATKTLGFDSDIFPNCASYEVTANSDTSAGAFMSYRINASAKTWDRYWVSSDFIDIISFGLTKGMILNIKSNDVVNNCYCYDSNQQLINTISFESSPYTVEVPDNCAYITIRWLFNSYTGVEGRIIDFKINNYCLSATIIENSDENKIIQYSQQEELAYLKESFELRHPDEDDVAEDWGFMGVDGDTTLGLKALIDWVDNCTDEEFVADFEEHFHKDYTLRYFCLVTLIGAVDNLG